MKVRRLLLVLAALSVAGTALAASATTGEKSGAPAAQALPLCPSDPEPGFSSAAEAEAAIARVPEEPICAADPSQRQVRTDAPVFRARQAGGRQYAGVQTIGRFYGGRVTIEVGDPAIAHNGGRWQAMAVWLNASPNQSNQPWLQIGWEEDSSDPTEGPNLYVEQSQPYRIATWGKIPPGRFISVRIRQCGTQACADVLTDDHSWRTLDTASAFSCNRGGAGGCYVASYLENMAGGHPSLDENAPGGAGVNVKNLTLFTSATGRRRYLAAQRNIFSAGSIADAGMPMAYQFCWVQRFGAFRVGRALVPTRGTQCE